MDVFTLVGIVLAFAAVFGSMVMEGGNPMSIVLIPPMLLVFVGTFGVGMACGLKRDTLSGLKSVKDALLTKSHPPEEIVKAIVGFAELARRDGLLALEEATKTIDDPFLRKGIQLAVDGTDPDEIYEIMEAQIKSRKVQDKAGAKFFADMGGFAPTLGIIGTVLGLVHVLEKPLGAGQARASHRRCVRGNALGCAHGQPVVAAHRQQTGARWSRERPPHGVDHGGRSLGAGRGQPAYRRAEASFVPER